MDALPRNHFGAILADPPWHFQCWKGAFSDGSVSGPRHARTPEYMTLLEHQIIDLPVRSLASENCVLFLWACWPTLEQALRVIEGWGFKYKTCAFSWTKAHVKQIDLFREDADASMGLGYWTRANTEPCLLAVRGKPKRLSADVRQGIIEPKREHSRKPDCVHDRIERLVAGPYLELFARKTRPNWTSWGNEVGKFDNVA